MTHEGPLGSVTSVPSSWKLPFSQKSISAWKICSDYKTPSLRARGAKEPAPTVFQSRKRKWNSKHGPV